MSNTPKQRADWKQQALEARAEAEQLAESNANWQALANAHRARVQELEDEIAMIRAQSIRAGQQSETPTG